MMVNSLGFVTDSSLNDILSSLMRGYKAIVQHKQYIIMPLSEIAFGLQPNSPYKLRASSIMANNALKSTHRSDIAPAPNRALDTHKWRINHVVKYMKGMYINIMMVMC